jgi:hypothetical protein
MPDASPSPLISEYQPRLEGGQGLNNLYKCITNGMPRVMSFTF